MVLLCLLVIAGMGYTVWFWPARFSGQTARNSNANQPIPVLVASAKDSVITAQQAAVRRKAATRDGTVALSARKLLQPAQHQRLG